MTDTWPHSWHPYVTSEIALLLSDVGGNRVGSFTYFTEVYFLKAFKFFYSAYASLKLCIRTLAAI